MVRTTAVITAVTAVIEQQRPEQRSVPPGEAQRRERQILSTVRDDLPPDGRDDDDNAERRGEHRKHPQHGDMGADGAIDPCAVVARRFEREQVNRGVRRRRGFLHLLELLPYQGRFGIRGEAEMTHAGGGFRQSKCLSDGGSDEQCRRAVLIVGGDLRCREHDANDRRSHGSAHCWIGSDAGLPLVDRQVVVLDVMEELIRRKREHDRLTQAGRESLGPRLTGDRLQPVRVGQAAADDDVAADLGAETVIRDLDRSSRRTQLDVGWRSEQQCDDVSDPGRVLDARELADRVHEHPGFIASVDSEVGDVVRLADTVVDRCRATCSGNRDRNCGDRQPNQDPERDSTGGTAERCAPGVPERRCHYSMFVPCRDGGKRAGRRLLDRGSSRRLGSL